MAQVASEISETVPAAAYAPDGFESARAEEAAAAPTEAAPEAAPVEAAPTLQVSLETAAAEAASATELAAAAADGAAAAAAAASVVPADAALRAAEIAARLAAEHGPPGATAYPVSSGMDHATEDSNKRKFNGPESYEGNDVAKRAYTEGQYHANNGATLQPIAPPEGHQPQYTGMEEATEIIMCPSTFVGKVIGKGGETIRDLQNRSSARIQIDHTGEEGRPRAITISGNRYAVDTAKKLVEDVISQGQDPSGTRVGGGDMKETVNCPPGIVGRVIGRGGETIRALQTASGAHISIDQNFPEGVDRQVHIQGNPENVARGLKMVSELIAGGPGSANDAIQKVIQKHGGGISRALHCPKQMVGRVIGKGGETIKALQNASGARIQIDQSTDPMLVTLTGSEDAVARAEASVTDIINGGSGFLTTGSPGQPAAYGAYPSYSQYQQYPGYSSYPQQAYSAYPGYSQQGSYQGYSGYPQQQAYGGYQQQGQSSYTAPTSQGYSGQYQQPASHQGQYGATDTSQASAAPSTGAVWQELHDPQGRPYYYNSQTGVSQWEKPAEMQ